MNAIPILAEQGKSLIERLDPITRSKVLSVLIVLLIVLFAVMGLAWLGFRFVRRYMNAKDVEPSTTTELNASATANESPWAEDESGPNSTFPAPK